MNRSEEENNETKKGCGRFFILGPPSVLFCFATSFTGIVLTDLIVYRACLVSLNINDTECSMLRTNASSAKAKYLEAKVEPYASMIVMTKSLIDCILPAVLSVFFGAWSDRGGRRPLFLAGFTGFSLMFITLALISIWNISPWYLLFPLIPLCFTGGSCTIALASICHITDTATDRNRMVLLAWLEASNFIGHILGGFIGPYVYKNYGYANAFAIAAGCCSLALIYTHFCIPETVKNPSKKSIRGVFKVSLLKELFESVSVKREGFHPPIIWLAICVMALHGMMKRGHGTIDFLFTRARLSWDVQYYLYFSTLGLALRVIGLSGVLLRKHVPDTLLAVMGFSSNFGATVTKSLSWESWHLYLSTSIGMFSAIVPSAIRSIISKFVPPTDAGKIFSLTTFLEALTPLAGAPLYALMYSHYLPPIYPSPVYLVSAIIIIFSILCVGCIHVMITRSRKSPHYTAASQEDRL